MKRKILAGALALITALSFAGCGDVEEGTADSSTADSSESVSSLAEDSGATEQNSSVQESAPMGDNGPNVIEVDLKTYRGEEVPQLMKAVKEMLNGASGSFEDFEKAFDPELLIRVKLMSSVSTEEELEELMAKFDDEAKKQTVTINYDLLHKALEGTEIKGDPINMKIQTVSGDLETSMVFTLNFDVDTSKGPMTFMGNAFRIDDKWGAVFEQSEHRSEEETLQTTE